MKTNLVMKTNLAAFALAALAFSGLSHGFDTVTVTATADNTMYEYEGFGQDLSNGTGSYLFAGVTASGLRRRGLISFDISDSIPPGSTIQSAALTLHLSQATFGPRLVTLHRALASWGEGNSDAPNMEGGGTAAKTNDATWRHRFYDSTLWNTPGGDFFIAPSSGAFVDESDFYTWPSTDSLVADVQGWLDNPASNFGWVIVGDESASATAKRFDSRQNSLDSFRPALLITFTLPGGPTCDPDMNQDGNADQGDIDYLINVIAGGDNPTNIDPDFNRDGNADQGDLDALVNVIAGGACP